jgi:hypothetical protein
MPIFKLGLQQGFATAKWDSTVILRSSNPDGRMSALGQKQT